MTYTRMRNQELSIKLKPSTSSSNIMYCPELVYNDVKKFIEEKYANEFLVDFQEKVGIDFFTKKYCTTKTLLLLNMVMERLCV